MKYLGRDLTKYVQDLYARNYNTLVRETLQEIRNGELTYVYGLEDLMDFMVLRGLVPPQTEL